MKINKSLIKELNEYLKEFDLTEIEYTEKDVKIKISKQSSANASSIKSIKSDVEIIPQKSDTITGTKVTSPIIGTAYLAPEPGGKKFVEIGKKLSLIHI